MLQEVRGSVKEGRKTAALSAYQLQTEAGKNADLCTWRGEPRQVPRQHAGCPIDKAVWDQEFTGDFETPRSRQAEARVFSGHNSIGQGLLL